MKKRFRLSDDQFNRVMEASKPTIAIWGSGGAPLGPSPQENANAAWRKVAAELGCEWDSFEDAGTGDTHDVLAMPLGVD